MTMFSPTQDYLRALLALPLAAVSLTLAGCMESKAQVDCPPADVLVTDVPEEAPGYIVGYLKKEQLPNSLAQIPPPPKADSSALAHDEAMSKAAYALKDTPRWQQAIVDANSEPKVMVTTFSCALGVPINDTDTPNLSRMMRRVYMDAAYSTDTAKKEYKRERPFMIHKEGTCTPAEEDYLSKDPSYPSGHTAVGSAWALALAEAAPDRADALVVRGRAFGESRMVCNMHWQSDVLQSRVLAAAVMARLRSESAFRADMEAARKDIAAARAKGLKPNADCAKEAAALAQSVPGAL